MLQPAVVANGRRQRRVDPVKVAVTAVLALAALEELAYLRRRIARATGMWWARVEHHEQSRLNRDELVYLLRRLASR